MADFAMQIIEAEQRYAEVQDKLLEIEALKAMEPKLRREAGQLESKIASLKSERAFFDQGVGGGAEDDEEFTVVPTKNKSKPKGAAAPTQPTVPVLAVPAKPDAPAEPAKPKAPTEPVERDAEGERKAKMRAINKKLQQIDKLKAKDAVELDQDAKEKLKGEAKLRQQLAALENGEEIEEEKPAPKQPQKVQKVEEVAKEEPKDDPEPDEDSEAQSMKLPTDPAEVEKRLRNLKKKLQQIAKLKEKGGPLDVDARQKVRSEYRLLQETEALEQGKDEVFFEEPPEATEEDEKIENQKKLKILHKKLEQIKKLKEKGGDMDADARAKVASEKALQKEANEVQAKITAFDQEERDRVAKRMGWESEVAQIAQEQKENKKSKAKAQAGSRN